jgi:iron complex outermembrane receptor protein
MRSYYLPAALLLATTAATAAAQTVLPAVDIATPQFPLSGSPAFGATLQPDRLAVERGRTSDSAELFSHVPGVAIQAAGGVSGLPAIHGLGADRVAIAVNGMTVGASCGNEMNPPLSYIDPARVAHAQIFTGVSPVSAGGDSIAGTIVVEPAAPQFAAPGRRLWQGGLSTFFRSASDAIGGTADAMMATEHVSIAYHGSAVRAHNYTGGGDRGTVRSSEYESYNQAVTLAARTGVHQITLDIGHQYVPRQGFPNQYMDMVDNHSIFANLRTRSEFGWGRLETGLYWQDVNHDMNFLADKLPGDMPMLTRSTTFGGDVKAQVPVGTRDLVRAGAGFHLFRIDDWWPAVAGSMMMGPQDYWNLNDARRNRVFGYLEWERAWSDRVSTLAGGRVDHVHMNTGAVTPYSAVPSMMNADLGAARAFNARPHARDDTNFDATLIARYQPAAGARYDLGFAVKSRSPNLYERYAWGTGGMASRMAGWWGDGNGYVGNLDLKPEVAKTVSLSGAWEGADWHLTFAPWYSRVDDYIGVEQRAVLNPATGVVQLRYVNQDAELYGIDFSADMAIADTLRAGSFRLLLTGAWAEGRNRTTGGSLYQVMPLHATATVEHRLGRWTSGIEVEAMADKDRVDRVRREPQTEGYALVHLRTAYVFGPARIDLGIRNLFDKGYDLPLGGRSLGDLKATGIMRPVPGRGRSFDAGFALRF